MFNEVVVVEGKNDERRLKEIYKEIETISVNGSEINKDSIKLIKEISKTRSIILFFDPDYPGQRIRSAIQDLVPEAKHAFVSRRDSKSKNGKKLGVEHASEEVIRKALDNALTPSIKKSNITMCDLFSLGIVGNKAKRIYLEDKLNLGYANSKTFLKRLNMIGINKEDLEVILSEGWKHQ